ncbi:hypothetical protein PCAR4_190009 [Paraburkholderia caribensis]|nr:hypothetical protein PCAR4_190009 [Paraburkholderia caribensis]
MRFRATAHAQERLEATGNAFRALFSGVFCIAAGAAPASRNRRPCCRQGHDQPASRNGSALAQSRFPARHADLRFVLAKDLRPCKRR